MYKSGSYVYIGYVVCTILYLLGSKLRLMMSYTNVNKDQVLSTNTTK